MQCNTLTPSTDFQSHDLTSTIARAAVLMPPRTACLTSLMAGAARSVGDATAMNRRERLALGRTTDRVLQARKQERAEQNNQREAVRDVIACLSAGLLDMETNHPLARKETR